MPPNEYQERFVSAMDDYFLACPGVSYLMFLSRDTDLEIALVQISGRVRRTTCRSPVTTKICLASSSLGYVPIMQHCDLAMKALWFHVSLCLQVLYNCCL